MPVVRKLPAPKAQTPKVAPSAVARQQLLLINGLLDEVARNYVARLHREIAELLRFIEKKQAGPGLLAPQAEGSARDARSKSPHLQINPERGRRKDLKKIDALIGDLQSIRREVVEHPGATAPGSWLMRYAVFDLGSNSIQVIEWWRRALVVASASCTRQSIGYPAGRAPDRHLRAPARGGRAHPRPPCGNSSAQKPIRIGSASSISAPWPPAPCATAATGASSCARPRPCSAFPCACFPARKKPRRFSPG